MKMTPPKSARRSFRLDTAMWLFTRVSGLAMIMTALVGLTGALFMGARLQMDLPTLMRWTFFPNPNHVVNSNISDVTLGWISAFWQVLQMLVVFFGATHGFNGLRVVIEDYVRSPAVCKALRIIIAVLWLVVLAFGVAVVLQN